MVFRNYINVYRCIQTHENNKFIFYKMVHDEIYRGDAFLNQVVAKRVTYLTTTRLVVAKWENPVLKWAGL